MHTSPEHSSDVVLMWCKWCVCSLRASALLLLTLSCQRVSQPNSVSAIRHFNSFCAPWFVGRLMSSPQQCLWWVPTPIYSQYVLQLADHLLDCLGPVHTDLLGQYSQEACKIDSNSHWKKLSRLLICMWPLMTVQVPVQAQLRDPMSLRWSVGI